jgi:hypothetical protein
MRYTIYEDPLTHRFAFLPLPNRFIDGDDLPAVAADRWFESYAEAVAALPELLNRDEVESGGRMDEPTPVDNGHRQH